MVAGYSILDAGYPVYILQFSLLLESLLILESTKSQSRTW